MGRVRAKLLDVPEVHPRRRAHVHRLEVLGDELAPRSRATRLLQAAFMLIRPTPPMLSRWDEGCVGSRWR